MTRATTPTPSTPLNSPYFSPYHGHQDDKIKKDTINKLEEQAADLFKSINSNNFDEVSKKIDHYSAILAAAKCQTLEEFGKLLEVLEKKFLPDEKTAIILCDAICAYIELGSINRFNDLKDLFINGYLHSYTEKAGFDHTYDFVEDLCIAQLKLEEIPRFYDEAHTSGDLKNHPQSKSKIDFLLSVVDKCNEKGKEDDRFKIDSETLIKFMRSVKDDRTSLTNLLQHYYPRPDENDDKSDNTIFLEQLKIIKTLNLGKEIFGEDYEKIAKLLKNYNIEKKNIKEEGRIPNALKLPGLEEFTLADLFDYWSISSDLDLKEYATWFSENILSRDINNALFHIEKELKPSSRNTQTLLDNSISSSSKSKDDAKDNEELKHFVPPPTPYRLPTPYNQLKLKLPLTPASSLITNVQIEGSTDVNLNTIRITSPKGTSRTVREVKEDNKNPGPILTSSISFTLLNEDNLGKDEPRY